MGRVIEYVWLDVWCCGEESSEGGVCLFSALLSRSFQALGHRPGKIELSPDLTCDLLSNCRNWIVIVLSQLYIDVISGSAYLLIYPMEKLPVEYFVPGKLHLVRGAFSAVIDRPKMNIRSQSVDTVGKRIRCVSINIGK